MSVQILSCYVYFVCSKKRCILIFGKKKKSDAIFKVVVIEKIMKINEIFI